MDEKQEEMSVKEQIVWYLDKIEKEKDLLKILTYVNRVLVGKNP